MSAFQDFELPDGVIGDSSLTHSIRFVSFWGEAPHRPALIPTLNQRLQRGASRELAKKLG